MADDPKLPKNISEKTAVSPQVGTTHMPTKSWFGSRLDELENRAALRAEIVMRERMQNNAQYIKALTESELAHDELINIDTTKEQIRDRLKDEHETAMANSKAERERSLSEADQLISEYEAKKAANRANQAEAEVREKRARAELDALQAKLDGAPEKIEQLKVELQSLMEEEIELSDIVKSLMGPENDGNETARAQVRRARANLRNIEEEISGLKKYLKDLRGW